MNAALLTPVDADATRRRFLSGLAAAGLLVACSDAPDATPADTEPGYPRTVGHLGGELVLARRPERIVTSSNFAGLEPLLALGVQPIAYGVRPNSELSTWARDALTVEGFAFDFTSPPLERIAAAVPDLIVVGESEIEQPQTERYRELAPVLVLPRGDELRLIGQVLAQEDDAAALQAEFTSRLAAIAPPAGGLTVCFAPGDGAFVYNPGTTSVAGTLAAAGAPLTDRGRPAGELGFSLSFEELGRLDDDRLWLVVPYAGEAGRADALEASPLFGQLPVVREGRYRRLTVEQSQAVLSATVLSTEQTVAALTELL